MVLEATSIAVGVLQDEKRDSDHKCMVASLVFFVKKNFVATKYKTTKQ